MSASLLIPANFCTLITRSRRFIEDVVADEVAVVGHLYVADRSVSPDEIARSRQAVKAADGVVRREVCGYSVGYLLVAFQKAQAFSYFEK